ncbi:acyl-CoA thioesterase [Arcticibacterium luteifluviistationis]|uniref:4-hydroxybenzoyl-CoA thioesterase n=1 Tax=Arcticibacterium luteifluviistationis TaxID=1784714 RepID=A0A2Z4GCZ6_9BACT|nr:acyl-CoA thioesterase [Arcticibacterium luteifluviistationis]AWV99169.1 4-hydroxybenzoyl-CoA thioesterase [Arcticibacterium luteifluviistationis]
MKTLVNNTEVKVRFSEVDSLGIVWHGHYVKFFEDGREAFGSEHGLGYMDVYEKGFATPIVKLNVDYKKTVSYGESIRIETTFKPTPAAKIVFDFKIFKVDTDEVVATGSSTQVFMTKAGQLHITNPPFFEEWKTKHGLV